jgi:adenylate cyclase, class 2
LGKETTETEVKLYTPDHAPIVQKLVSLGARRVYERILERNLRYENAENSLMQQGITLRLREDSRIRLTYKDGGSIVNGITTRNEYEVDVSDMDMMNQILHKLGYHVALTYEKYRTTYEFYGAEVVIDELPYGNFTEIEGDLDTIEDIIRTLNLQDATRYPESYTRLFLNVKHRLNLSFNDLTFANFEGIVVTVQAFKGME